MRLPAQYCMNKRQSHLNTGLVLKPGLVSQEGNGSQGLYSSIYGTHTHTNTWHWRVQDLEEGARSIAHKLFSHDPKTLTIPLIKQVLEDSWMTKKAVLGQVAMRNCHLGSEC